MSSDVLNFNQAEIDLAALRHNFICLQQMYPLRSLMAVVKGDAYGHGLEECARALVQAGAGNLGVLDAEEGVRLVKAKIQADIHILAGLQTKEQIKAAVENKLIIVAYSLPQLKLIEDLAPKGSAAQVYLKIDTGMGRLGLPWREAPAVLPNLVRNTKIFFRGLMTHLATAGDSEAKLQLDRFEEIIEIEKSLSLTGGLHSALAGPGILAHPEYEDSMPRAGLLLYGANPLETVPEQISPERVGLIKKLKPVMTLVSQVIQVRTIRAGETVSYDRTYSAPSDLKAAVLPLGYVHGLSRSRSSNGWALIDGRPAPLLGRVCMNLTMFDVSSHPDPRPGQRAVILGRDGQAVITAAQAAQWQGTSAYEIFCLFGRLNARAFKD
ncbi:MAG: alanine racemase [Deltaproteobacteria bacterium]|jgi:alanine racemase|nr:alanine racemase [Deltaproteobacteria bacterium]